MEDGKTAFAPQQQRQKRKRPTPESGAKKRQRRMVDSDDDEEDCNDDDENEAEDDSDAGDEAREPLSGEAIDQKLDELKQLKKEARQEKRNIDARIRQLRQDLSAFDGEEEQIVAQTSALCIAGRNEYSRSAIQLDFAAGIKE